MYRSWNKKRFRAWDYIRELAAACVMFASMSFKPGIAQHCYNKSRVVFQAGEFGAVILDDSLDDSLFQIMQLEQDVNQRQLVIDALIESRRVLHNLKLQVKSLEFQQKKIDRNLRKLAANFVILLNLRASAY